MNVLIGLLAFGVAWFVLNLIFERLVGRMMRFGEGIIYPIIVCFIGAAIIGQLGPSPEERRARDLQEYNRLTKQVNAVDAEQRFIQECLQRAVAARVSKTYLECQSEYRR